MSTQEQNTPHKIVPRFRVTSTNSSSDDLMKLLAYQRKHWPQMTVDGPQIINDGSVLSMGLYTGIQVRESKHP